MTSAGPDGPAIGRHGAVDRLSGRAGAIVLLCPDAYDLADDLTHLADARSAPLRTGDPA